MSEVSYKKLSEFDTLFNGLSSSDLKLISDIVIRKEVEKLGRHLLAFDNYMQKLGKHLGTTCNTYETAYKELSKIDKDVVKITEGERKIEPLQIDKPHFD